ncbi:MAG TPA: hypothetical protein VFA26_00545, partial [Gemmataceae bacterium]|nr:hypothetical protein [Gemmataceae bacterium]
CVSIYQPTSRGPQMQDRAVWKGLVRRADDLLRESGRRPSEVRELLQPFTDKVDDPEFWLAVSNGLAAFHSPQMTHFWRLPVPFAEKVVIGDRFHIKPLLPLLTADSRFFILAVSQKNVRLLEGTRQTVREVAIPDVPKSYDEALQYTSGFKSQSLHTHTAPGGPAGNREAIFHGSGTVVDSAKDGVLEFCEAVARGVEKHLHDQQAPLVLAASEPVLSLYRKANHYDHLLGQAIEGFPDRTGDKELHDRALALVTPVFEEERGRIAGLYRQLAGTGRTTNDLREVVQAAHQGRIQYLFVAKDQEQWGRFVPETGEVRRRPEAGPEAEDLLNLAAVNVLAHKGTVWAVDTAEMPDRAPAAALYWLPVGERGAKRRV